MADLHVTLGAASRTVLSEAIAGARCAIDAQFFSIGDEAIVDALNSAARRGVAVTLHVEGDRGRYQHRGPHIPNTDHLRDAASAYAKMFDRRIHIVVEGDADVLEHGKALVVDSERAFVATGNPNQHGFDDPGQVLVEDDEPADVTAIRDAIGGVAALSSRVVSGPSGQTRERVVRLLTAPRDERVASEDLSDPGIVVALIKRRATGMRDEILVNCEEVTTPEIRYLAAAGVDVRTLPNAHLHEKFIDAGDRIYVGSANLTRNGLDEAREIGVIANASDFGCGAAALRADFDAMWSKAVPITA